MPDPDLAATDLNAGWECFTRADRTGARDVFAAGRIATYLSGEHRIDGQMAASAGWLAGAVAHRQTLRRPDPRRLRRRRVDPTPDFLRRWVRCNASGAACTYMPPGRSRATVTVTDAAGNVSKPLRVSFRIVRR